MSLSRFSWREAWARPSRVLLTFFSIAIGVGAVVAVLLANATTRSAQQEMLGAVTGRADLEILANSTQGFSYESLKSVRESSQVEVAIPTLNRIATLFTQTTAGNQLAAAGGSDDSESSATGDGNSSAVDATEGGRSARVQVLGIDPRIDRDIREYEVAAGSAPTTLMEIMLDESLSKSLQVDLGEQVKLLGPGGLKAYQVVGVVRPTGQSGLSLGGAVYMVLPAAQRLFKAGGNIDQILVVGGDGADLNELMEELSAIAGFSATVRVPRTSSDMAQETMYATENGMRMAFAFALLIATFIIYNTFQMAVGERRKQLGILRAIGATRKQVFGIIMKEALTLSILGTIAGCLLGYWGAGWLNGVTEQFLQVELPRVKFAALPFIFASLLGVSVSLLGAFLPAKRASEVLPTEAIRNLEISHNEVVVRQSKMVAIASIPIGSLVLLTAIFGWLPVGFDVVGIVLILLGCVALIPYVLTTGTGVLVHFLQRWIGIEARLAQKQLLRNVGRTTLTIGVLFVAVATCVGMAGNIMDNVANVQDWYSRAVIGDFFVRASMPNFTTGAAADLPPEVAEEVRNLDGVESVRKTSIITARSGEDSVVVVTRDFEGDARDFFDLSAAGDSDVVQSLNRGQAVIGSVLAQRRGLSPGDTIPLETEVGQAQLEIAAVVNEYMAGGLTVYLSRTTGQELLGVSGTTALIVDAKPGQISNVESNLQSFCSNRGLILQSHGEMLSFIDAIVNGVVASMWMLLSLGCVIAALGLVNTLTMNILEQTREIGVLRVVAMTRRQIRTMIFAQATLMGFLGLIPGALAGVFVAFAISQSSLMVLGHSIQFRFRPGLVVGCVLIGAVVIALASLVPAERATRLKLSLALRTE